MQDQNGLLAFIYRPAHYRYMADSTSSKAVYEIGLINSGSFSDPFHVLFLNRRSCDIVFTVKMPEEVSTNSSGYIKDIDIVDIFDKITNHSMDSKLGRGYVLGNFTDIVRALLASCDVLRTTIQERQGRTLKVPLFMQKLEESYEDKIGSVTRSIRDIFLS